MVFLLGILAVGAFITVIVVVAIREEKERNKEIEKGKKN